MKRVLFLLVMLFECVILHDFKDVESYIYCNACSQLPTYDLKVREKIGNGDTLTMRNKIEDFHSLKTNKAEERAALLEKAIECEKHHNHSKATEYINQAFYTFDLAVKAGNGDTDAAFKLASYYENLERLGYRDSITFYLYYMASINANIKARTKVGMCYEEGRCVEKNINKAFKYYYRAAELGEPEAMIRLGDLYRKGLGVEQSDFLAFDYYTKAFQSDSIDTLLLVLPRLEECYSSGIGVEKDRLIAGLISKAKHECINGSITDAFFYIRAARKAKTQGSDVFLFIAIILLFLIIKRITA